MKLLLQQVLALAPKWQGEGVRRVDFDLNSSSLVRPCKYVHCIALFSTQLLGHCVQLMCGVDYAIYNTLKCPPTHPTHTTTYPLSPVTHSYVHTHINCEPHHTSHHTRGEELLPVAWMIRHLAPILMQHCRHHHYHHQNTCWITESYNTLHTHSSSQKHWWLSLLSN